jgi:quinolinate synthase
MELVEKILELKKRKNAIILAHYYQTNDIQDIADFVGDSLGLSEKANTTKADIIVFAGVHFMAETAKILNPSAKVLLPDMNAGCSLADSCPGPDFQRFKEQYPDHKVISYINCSAEIKTLSDVICTSSNAVKIVESFPQNAKLIFAPDRNLGAWVNRVTGRNMVLWNGSCQIHDHLSSEAIIKLKIQHPDAMIIAHPECKGEVLEMAGFIGSTTELLKYTAENACKKFIVATETGILHQMKKESPEKEFFIVTADESCSCNDCPFMKLNTMEKLYLCLLHEKPEIVLDDYSMKHALLPIKRMLEISRKSGLLT